MDFYKRYSKEIMESFALRVLKFSFDSKYGEYFAPANSDNFDYISPDGNDALEITSIKTKTRWRNTFTKSSKQVESRI